MTLQSCWLDSGATFLDSSSPSGQQSLLPVWETPSTPTHPREPRMGLKACGRWLGSGLSEPWGQVWLIGHEATIVANSLLPVPLWALVFLLVSYFQGLGFSLPGSHCEKLALNLRAWGKWSRAWQTPPLHSALPSHTEVLTKYGWLVPWMDGYSFVSLPC